MGLRDKIDHNMDPPINYFTFITYNLDSQGMFVQERFNSFIKQIKGWKPDILVIQEGTNIIYSNLFLLMSKMGYNKKHFGDCGEVIFSKFEIKESEFILFQHTKQNRGITKYIVDVYGTDVCIATTQLETCGPLIKKQIAQIDHIFSKLNVPVILGGDFRITDYQKDITEPDGWQDVWYESGTSKQEYSMDNQINRTINVRDRPDRIWCISRDKIESDECLLVGLPEPYTETLIASSHFGVYSKFRVLN